MIGLSDSEYADKGHQHPECSGADDKVVKPAQLEHAAGGALLAQYLLLRNAAIDRRLSASHVAVLAVIVDHYNRRTGRAFPGFVTMSKLTALHRSTVIRAVEDLERFGIVRVLREHMRPNVYTVTWPTSRDWPTSSAEATGSRYATSSAGAIGPVAPVHTTSSVRAHGPVALVRPEPALKQPALNLLTEPTEELSLTPLAESPMTTRFAEFWAAYPKKVGKKQKVEGTWKRRGLDKLADTIIANVRERTAHDEQWQAKKFIPHPATYINNDRWLDEWQRATPKAPAGQLARDSRSPEEIAAANSAELARFGFGGAR